MPLPANQQCRSRGVFRSWRQLLQTPCLLHSHFQLKKSKQKMQQQLPAQAQAQRQRP